MNKGTNKGTKAKKPVKKRTPTRKKKQKKSTGSFLGLTMIFVFLALITVMIIRNCAVREPDDFEIVDVEGAIRYAAYQLGVPENLVRKSVRDDGVHFSIALDGDRVDLVFANMIISGQVELAGGEIISGQETTGGTVHVIRIRDEKTDTDYVVRLSYDRRSSYPEKKPKLAIIVDDFGEFAGSLLDDFLTTDPNVTFAILPNLRYSRTVMDRATATGREVMLHIPMEPVGYPRNNPGDNPILVEHTDREINRLVEGYLRELPRVVGANNHMGSLATADERVMTSLLGALSRHDLFFIDSRTTQHTVAIEVAQRMQLPITSRDLFLDDPESSERIMRERLQQLRNMKGQKEHVVVITHCFDRQRLDILNKFIEEAKKIGYEIVPASHLFISDLPEIL